MCHNYFKHYLLFLFTIITAFSASAQSEFSTKNGETAPYSKFGIGEQRNGVGANLRAMGSISSAYTNPFALNSDNPASYASLLMTTYEAGGEGSTRNIQTATETYRSGMGNLAYLAVGIPVNKYMGLSFGLRPQTRVYYLFNDTSTFNGLGTAVTSDTGYGSVNYAYFGAAGKYKGFSIGFNFGYSFGTIFTSQALYSFADSPKHQNSVFASSTKVGSIYYKLGAMYETKLNSKLSMRVGATFSLNQDITASRNEYAYSNWFYRSGTQLYTGAKDTVTRIEGEKGTITLPMTYTAGVQLIGTDKWMVGVDYSSTNWSQYRSYGNTDSLRDNAMKIAVGGEYTPNIGSMRNYFQRVTYRLGFYYGQDCVYVRNTDINFYAVTFGASLPFKRSTDRLHTAFEIGSRGTTANGLIKETFVKFTMGISLNDKWFIKRKYE